MPFPECNVRQNKVGEVGREAKPTAARVSLAHFFKNESGRKKKVGAKYVLPTFSAHLPTFSKMGFFQKWAAQSVEAVGIAHMPTSPTFKKAILNSKGQGTMSASMFDAVLTSPISGKNPCASPLPPLKAIPGAGVKPDYAAFCSAWHQGCFACPNFLRDKVRFCRKWNRTFTGADVVELITEGEEGAASPPLPEPALQKEDTGRGWWTYGREVNGIVNTVDHKKGEVLTS